MFDTKYVIGLNKIYVYMQMKERERERGVNVYYIMSALLRS